MLSAHPALTEAIVKGSAKGSARDLRPRDPGFGFAIIEGGPARAAPQNRPGVFPPLSGRANRRRARYPMVMPEALILTLPERADIPAPQTFPPPGP